MFHIFPTQRALKEVVLFWPSAASITLKLIFDAPISESVRTGLLFSISFRHLAPAADSGNAALKAWKSFSSKIYDASAVFCVSALDSGTWTVCTFRPYFLESSRFLFSVALQNM